MQLEEFISKNEKESKELVKCGSCQNILLHCGDYEIVKVGMGRRGKKKEEAVLCETCKKNGIQIELVTLISEDNNYIFQIPISQLDIPLSKPNHNKKQEDTEKEDIDSKHLEEEKEESNKNSNSHD